MNYRERKDQIVHDESLVIRPVTVEDLPEIFDGDWNDEDDLDGEPRPLNFHTPDEDEEFESDYPAPKKRFPLTAVALAVALAVPMVCQAQVQTTPPASASTSATVRHHTFLGALKGGSIGCLAGGAIQLLRHGNPIKGCLVAGAVGAAIGGVRAYHEQMEQARDLAAANQAAGGSAAIATKTVEAKADDGQTQSTQALTSVTLPLNPEGVADHTASTTDVLTKAATMTAQASRPMSIKVQGTDEQRAWIVSQLRATNPKVQITEADATSPTLTLVAA